MNLKRVLTTDQEEMEMYTVKYSKMVAGQQRDDLFVGRFSTDGKAQEAAVKLCENPAILSVEIVREMSRDVEASPAVRVPSMLDALMRVFGGGAEKTVAVWLPPYAFEPGKQFTLKVDLEGQTYDFRVRRHKGSFTCRRSSEDSISLANVVDVRFLGESMGGE